MEQTDEKREKNRVDVVSQNNIRTTPSFNSLPSIRVRRTSHSTSRPLSHTYIFAPTAFFSFSRTAQKSSFLPLCCPRRSLARTRIQNEKPYQQYVSPSLSNNKNTATDKRTKPCTLQQSYPSSGYLAPSTSSFCLYLNEVVVFIYSNPIHKIKTKPRIPSSKKTTSVPPPPRITLESTKALARIPYTFGSYPLHNSSDDNDGNISLVYYNYTIFSPFFFQAIFPNS